MNVPDAIERELILPASRERVWAALTEPHSLAAWFGTRATVDLQPGGAVTFFWENSSGEQHTNSGVIEVVEPLRRFAFRWHVHDGQHTVPPADSPTTLVEFTLDDHPEGTRLHLVESGFASLATDFGASAARDLNTQGWDRELAELIGFLADAAEV